LLPITRKFAWFADSADWFFASFNTGILNSPVQPIGRLEIPYVAPSTHGGDPQWETG
jgi:hypothetical protein